MSNDICGCNPSPTPKFVSKFCQYISKNTTHECKNLQDNRLSLTPRVCANHESIRTPWTLGLGVYPQHVYTIVRSKSLICTSLILPKPIICFSTKPYLNFFTLAILCELVFLCYKFSVF